MDATRHRPFMDGKFKGFWDSLKNSPYPLHYALRWPLYFYHPSLTNMSGLKPLPARVEAPDAPDVNDASTVKLLFAGDIMVLNGDRPPILCPQLCSLIQRSDLFVANLEAPVGPHAPRPDARYAFTFHMPLSFLLSIQEQTGLPFEQWVLTNANNHSGDAGAAGFAKSIALLDALSICHVGWHGDRICRSVEVKGMHLAFVAWTHWLNRDLGEASHALVTNHDVDTDRIANIRRDENADFLVCLPHWEYEFQHFPRRSTRRFARKLLSHAVDLVVGSHPHVLQPYEQIGNKYCFYSLGNFCGLGISWPVKIISLLELHLNQCSSGDAGVVSRFRFHHFYQLHVNDEIRIVPVEILPPDQQKRVVGRVSRMIRHAEPGIAPLSTPYA